MGAPAGADRAEEEGALGPCPRVISVPLHYSTVHSILPAATLQRQRGVPSLTASRPCREKGASLCHPYLKCLLQQYALRTSVTLCTGRHLAVLPCLPVHEDLLCTSHVETGSQKSAPPP